MSKKIRGGYIAWFIISVLFVILPIWVLATDDGYGEDNTGAFYLTIPIMLISAALAGYAMKTDYSMSDEEKRIEKQQKDKKKQLFEKIKLSAHIENVAYLSGHHTYTESQPKQLGFLAIIDDQLLYWFFNDEKFRIPISQIRSIIYDISENISVTRGLMLGLSALVFKKKTYYLIIEYIAENGLANTLVFSPDKKDNNFLNQLNAARNKYATTRDENSRVVQVKSIQDPLSLNDKLEKLKELYNHELISEDDYNRKKTDLLKDL